MSNNLIESNILDMKQILRRKKNNGYFIYGDKVSKNNFYYKSNYSNYRNMKHNEIKIMNSYGKIETVTNYKDIMNSTPNMVGFKKKERIEILSNLFYSGRLNLTKCDIKTKKKILNFRKINKNFLSY